MANFIEITSEANAIRLEYNQLATASKFIRAYVKKTSIRSVALAVGGWVEVEAEDRNYQFSFDGANSIAPVSSVNGVAPTSNEELYNLFVVALG